MGAAARNAEQLTQGLFEYASNPFCSRPEQRLETVEDLSWLDLSRLEGFSAVVEDVLAGNEQLPPWFARAAGRQFELRVRHVERLAATR